MTDASVVWCSISLSDPSIYDVGRSMFYVQGLLLSVAQPILDIARLLE